MKKYFKYLAIYLKFKKEINYLYGYSLKMDSSLNEDANWFDRTDYFIKST